MPPGYIRKSFHVVIVPPDFQIEAYHFFVSFIVMFLFTSILNTMNFEYFALYSWISSHRGLLFGIGNSSSRTFIIGIYTVDTICTSTIFPQIAPSFAYPRRSSTSRPTRTVCLLKRLLRPLISHFFFPSRNKSYQCLFNGTNSLSCIVPAPFFKFLEPFESMGYTEFSDLFWLLV